MLISNRLVPLEKSDDHFQSHLINAREGRFWHWKRTYVVQDSDSRIYALSLNLFQRLYASLFGNGIDTCIKQAFRDKKITGLLPADDVDLLFYNSHPRPPLEGIYKNIAQEAKLWRGHHPINLISPNPEFTHIHDRKEWWGRTAEIEINTAFEARLRKIIENRPAGVAVDIGCGSSISARTLLSKGWKVICIDNSPRAINAMRDHTNYRNEKWLQTGQLTLVCEDIENYTFPDNVDLVVASSALPYFDPSKFRSIMDNIFHSLKEGGHFIGNLFAKSYVGLHANKTREMGAWLIDDKDSVGKLLAGHGYDLLECRHGSPDNPHSAVFTAQKSQVSPV